ncbi:uncharacterized protein LOC141661080 [Apium graveolens]|uniref:uncharacterized protein LOC141661080 n=1 Tax=Apium graveolens TaxID=4045 RepID=UPI003D78C7FF
MGRHISSAVLPHGLGSEIEEAFKVDDCGRAQRRVRVGDDGFGLGSSALSLGTDGLPVARAVLGHGLVSDSIESNSCEDVSLQPLLGREGGDPIIVHAALVDELIGDSIDSNTYEDGSLLPLLGRGVFSHPGLGQVAGEVNTNIRRRVRRALDFCAPLDRRSCDVGRVLVSDSGIAAPVLANGIVGDDIVSLLPDSPGGADQRDQRCRNLNISRSLDRNVSGVRQVLKRAPEGDIGYLD